MIVLDFEQGSPEWHAARCGKVSASRVADMTALNPSRKGWGASRANYAAELVAERLSGVPAEKFVSEAMQRGTATEGEARQLYTLMSDVSVQTVGLVLHPLVDMACASPDGLAGNDGLVEFKCPNTATHIATLLGGTIDGKYVKQMQWQMACTARAWCDFVSFDPRLPAEMQLHVTRVPRDEELIRELEKQAAIFLAEVADTVAQLTALYMKEAA